MDNVVVETFSALGRAVWDETHGSLQMPCQHAAFSALGRAVWDETGLGRDPPSSAT